jgi:hypothetical protein
VFIFGCLKGSALKRTPFSYASFTDAGGVRGNGRIDVPAVCLSSGICSKRLGGICMCEGALALPPPKQEWRIIRKNFFRIYDLMTRFHCLRASCLAAAIGGSALVVGMAPAAQAAITE